MNKALGLIVVLSSVSVSACKTVPETSLSPFNEKFGYVSFNPPRDGDGVGAIIDFKNVSESLVARPDQCILSKDAKITSKRTNAVIGKVDWKIEKNSKNSLGVPESLLKYANFDGVYNLEKIQSAEIVLSEPFEDKIPRLSVMSAQDRLQKIGSACTGLFSDNENLLIHSVLGGNALEFTFRDNQNRVVNISASILNQIGGKSENTKLVNGGEAAVYNGEVYVGYRAWNITRAAGSLGKPLKLTEVPIQELQKLENEK